MSRELQAVRRELGLLLVWAHGQLSDELNNRQTLLEELLARLGAWTVQLAEADVDGDLLDGPLKIHRESAGGSVNDLEVGR